MPEIPKGAKVPNDRKSKSKDGDVPEAFSFEHDGETYTFAPTDTALTPGFIRRNRNNDIEFSYGLIELLADEATMKVLDDMPLGANMRVLRDFDEYTTAYLKVSLGE